MIKIDKQKNVRESFIDWYERSFRPNLKLVSAEIEISHWSLVQFKNEKINLKPTKLQKVIDFIEEQSTSALRERGDFI